MMPVVVGIIRNPLGEILIAKRPEHKYKGGLWEFPGGKIEPSETPLDALKRELREELNIEVIKAESWLQCEYDYSDRFVLLHIWNVTQFSGNPEGVEGQPLCWVSQNNLKQFTFPEGNQVILDKLSRC